MGYQNETVPHWLHKGQILNRSMDIQECVWMLWRHQMESSQPNLLAQMYHSFYWGAEWWSLYLWIRLYLGWWERSLLKGLFGCGEHKVYQTNWPRIVPVHYRCMARGFLWSLGLLYNIFCRWFLDPRLTEWWNLWLSEWICLECW